MEWSIFKQENEFVMITEEKIDDIPYLRFNPKEYTGKIQLLFIIMDGIQVKILKDLKQC